MITKLQLTIYLKETDMSGDLPLYELIVRRLLHLHIAGATVVRGIMGYGRHHYVHRKGLLGVSDDHPVVVVSVDEASKIHGVLPEIRQLVGEGLITTHEVGIP
jgi:PII-like signaling protein